MPTDFINRRRFAASLAAGALAAAPAAAAQGAAAADAKDPPAAIDPVALVLDRVKQQYPDRLEAEHLEQIRQQIERHQAISQVLSQFPLTNADEPASTFRAYRREG